MTMNPMQRKARNSFLLGFLIMLVIAAIIIGLLLMQISNMKSEEEENPKILAYILTRDIKSGEEITQSDVIQMELETAPINAINGTDYNNLRISTADNSGQEKTLAKVDLSANTVLAKSMIYTESQDPSQNLRMQEYSMISLPARLEVGEYIDIRLRLPSGQDYIVVARKYVEDADEDTIWVKMSEAEIVTMSNAIVEAYQMTGSLLYANRHTDAGLNTDVTPTYIVSNAVGRLINQDPNIINEAKNALNAISASNAEQRTAIENALTQYGSEAKTNIEEGVSTERQKALEKRSDYLQVLDTTVM